MSKGYYNVKNSGTLLEWLVSSTHGGVCRFVEARHILHVQRASRINGKQISHAIWDVLPLQGVLSLIDGDLFEVPSSSKVVSFLIVIYGPLSNRDTCSL